MLGSKKKSAPPPPRNVYYILQKIKQDCQFVGVEDQEETGKHGPGGC